MNKKDLARSAVEILKDNNTAKFVKLKKHTFYITDDEGNKAAFEVKDQSRSIPFTIDDVMLIIDALTDATFEALKSGEEINLKGFASLSLEKNKAHRVTHPLTNEPYMVPARYVPRIKAGESLRLAAKIYTLAHPLEEDSSMHEASFEEFEV